MEIESSLVAAQNGLAITPNQREPQREAENRQQEAQRQSTELPRTQVVVRQATPEAYAEAERFREQRQATADQPNSRSRNAIDAYQSLANQQQRSEVQRLLGIDTYA